jgi:hypothetical protein
MDGPSPGLVLKELKRIKWLLVLIAVALLSVPLSLLYVGWEVVSLLEEKPAEEDEGTFQTTADELLRGGRFDELGRVIDRRSRARHAAERRYGDSGQSAPAD